MAVAKIIDGKGFADRLILRISQKVNGLKQSHDITPGLAVVLVGEDPASKVYVSNKAKQTKFSGMNSFEHRLDANISEDKLLSLIQALNQDKTVNGILVQLPLPRHIDSSKVLLAIDPNKDVDGFHVVNVGRLSVNDSHALVPCTPQGCLLLLEDYLGKGNLKGANAVVLGRSNIVGKPMAQLLLASDCTVTIAHSRTQNIEAVARHADILIAAIGKPEIVKANWVKKGAVLIDVGINRIQRLNQDGENKNILVGDIDFQEAIEVAGAITPVPGGVGPMTIACLLRNTLIATYQQNRISIDGSV